MTQAALSCSKQNNPRNWAFYLAWQELSGSLGQTHSETPVFLSLIPLPLFTTICVLGVGCLHCICVEGAFYSKFPWAPLSSIQYEYSVASPGSLKLGGV